VLALFFLYGGLIKQVPPGSLSGVSLEGWLLSPLPKPFVSCTGFIEMFGESGLILSARRSILPILPPLTVVGLILEMIGAAIFVLLFYAIAPAAFSMVTRLLLAFVASGCSSGMGASDGRQNVQQGSSGQRPS